ETPLGQQSATLNPSRSPRPLLDLTYQLLGIGFALVPVALALFLLSEPGRSAVRRIGLDRGRPVRDLGAGRGLAALVGLPGLGLYVVGRALGVTAQGHASALTPSSSSAPVLTLAALQTALLEEVAAVAYLRERRGQRRWSTRALLAASARLPGAYHPYKGIG